MRKNPASRSKLRSKVRKIYRKTKFWVFVAVMVFTISSTLGYFFLQPFIENSFVFARGGIGQDFNSANKYSLLLVHKDSSNLLKEINLIIFDRKNRKLYDYSFDMEREIFLTNKGLVSLKNSWSSSLEQSDFVTLFEKNFGTIVDLTMVLDSDFFQLYRKTVIGDSNLMELADVLQNNQLGRRNTLLMYSFSKSVDPKFYQRMNISGTIQMDRELTNVFLDSEMGLEEKSISIVNTTSTNGLGRKVSRYVTNMGGRVISISGNSQEVSESVLLYKEPSQSLENLSRILGIKKVEKYNDENISTYYETVKSDIVVIIGTDFEGLK